MQETGSVRWFNDAKGYGFIVADNGGDDLFVHYTAIGGMRGRRTLTEGARVEFVRSRTDKGFQAENVFVLEPAAESAR